MNRTPFEVELADRLSRLADRAPATPGDRSTPIELEPALSGRSRRLGLLAGVAVALVAVVAGSWLLDRSDSSDLVATDATPTSDDARSDVPLDWPLVGDEWSTISVGPAGGRAFPVQVWTGAELIVWGGESEPETTWTGDGAAYDPMTDMWRDLPPGPLSARSEHLAVWTGTEVLICCGRAPGDEGQAAAAYDPVADTWRVLSPPPFDSALGVAVWTGAEMIVTGGVDLREAWAYSPASDEWRELSAPSSTIERSADIAWTGTHIIVWGVFGTGSGLTYEPATDTWAALPSLPSDLAIWGGSMVWTGDEVVVWGNSRADDTDAVGARIRLDASQWTPIADDPLEAFRWWEGVPGSNSAVWTGTEMLVWAGAMGESDGSTRTLAYDPAGDAWRELGTAPTTAFGPDLLWTGDVALAMTDPVTAIRPTAPSGDPAPTPRAGPATIQGVLPNGDRYEISADPPLDSEVEGISAGIIIDLDDGTTGPVVGIANFQRATGDERVGPNATGTSIVVIAGEWRLTISIYDHVLAALGPDAASIIYDAIVPRTVADASDLPAFDLQAPLRWATDLEIPLQMQVMYREFVVRRGCSEVAAVCSEDGIVEVVPIEEVVSTDTRWADNNIEILHLTDGTGADSHQQSLDLGPLEPRGGHSVTWSGREMIVWGGSASEDGDVLFNDGAAFDPVANEWRLLAPSPLSPRQYHAAVWDGAELLVVGGAGELDGAAYDPEQDRWRALPALPFELEAQDPAYVWAGDRLVVWNPTTDQVASLDPNDDRWNLLPSVDLDVAEGVLRWDGESVYAVGSVGRTLDLARLEAGEWLGLPANIGSGPRSPGDSTIATLTGWAGGRLIAWSRSGSDGSAASFDPATGQWEDIAAPNVPPCEGWAGSTAVDDRLLVFGMCGDAGIFDQVKGVWTPVPLGALGNGRYSVWTGTELLNWGDTCCYGTANQPFTVAAWRTDLPE